LSVKQAILPIEMLIALWSAPRTNQYSELRW